MQKVTTRIAEAADAGTVASLVHGLLDELWGGKGPDVEALTRTAATVLGDPGVIAAIAYVDDEAVGVLTLNECNAIYAGGKFGEISELYVRPNMRSQGVAPHLVEEALAQARLRGWKRLEVGAPSQPKWSRSLNFYLRNGFREMGPRLCRDI
ncbi:acetyltransferase (GNAT) family domain-containing protein [Purpureocillium lavendulum]|uniref:Acetyltransferase (GNAT) family domain-containing protein n=1 Tax=Purpureocillium lavendulum TaxID=1247861 RepID=A0AB34FFK8_9HYPO|nr:acetyltransferase (GNAT) family domain-containing protein [Purpureocillium lavendulum]